MNTNYYTTSDNVKIGYSDQGEGIPLLLLSGLTRNASDFEYLMPHLAGYRVIRPDYRGRGRSDWAPHDTYTVPIQARDQIELLDHLGIDKIAIIGTSLGGLISMVLAVTAIDRLAGVCFNDIGPEVSDEGRKFIMTYLGRRPPQKTLQDAALARAKFMDGFAGVPMERWLQEAKNHYIEENGRLNITYDPALRKPYEQAKNAEQPDLWPCFDALSHLPIALIRGENSDILTNACADEMRKRRPDMPFENVKDRGHVPFLDEPQSLTVIHKFLDLL
ncbi:alpha/beta fold hydrolase [Halocynthiibacter namhaensis]|uniref:alpha/beta fold hydrolase n=1 Tax=Halocynthiibacter namhaensis TaxID=1290553 RepID=UPI0005791CF8|nr:alpha/beta hydrolase [Halocynthiibacter namhaensis]